MDFLKKLTVLFFLITGALLPSLSCFSDDEGSSEGREGLMMKYTPVEVIATEGDAVSLFDRDTNTAFSVSKKTSVTVKFSGKIKINRVRIFGQTDYNIKTINKTSNKEINSLSLNKNLSSKGWKDIDCDGVKTDSILLEITPSGSSGIREMEIWGNDDAAVDDRTSSLVTARDADSINGILAGPAVRRYGSNPGEIEIASSSKDNAPSFRVEIEADPSLYKKAFLIYNGYNVYRPFCISRKINDSQWQGGLSEIEGSTSWALQAEEISPSVLKKGTNVVSFSAENTISIKDLSICLVGDSGWNSVDYSSSTELGDSNTGTSKAIQSGDDGLVVNFDRSVQVDNILLHVNGKANAECEVYYNSVDAWKNVKKDFSADMSEFKKGWNRIYLPSGVVTDSIKLKIKSLSGKNSATVSINELRATCSPIESESDNPKVIVSYPLNGEYFGRTAYVQGFVTPSSSLAGSGHQIQGNALNMSADGSFRASITKDSAGFSSQSDDDPWNAVIEAELSGECGKALKNVNFTKNSVLPESGTKGNSSSNPGNSGANGSVNNNGYHGIVSPGSSKQIKYGDVTLDIPAGTVDTDTEFQIIPLTASELAELDQGMVNVTSPVAGYRFLPHKKFKKNLKISFKYSKSLFIPGQTDQDVYMFYYNEKGKRWERLARTSVDSTTETVTSESDHFTDIINSTLIVPEHPDALTFNPNSIKDIKAADPSAGVNLIEAPQANSNGDANLSYPIEIPKGRAGLQPELAVRYSSSGGNDWMGLGWNITVPSVSINTKFGVPRYDGNETYMLEGAELVKVSGNIYRPRVEGAFRKIEKMGDSPSNCYWRVTDKNGTVYIYGQGANSRLASYKNNNIFQWNLESVTDSNGNTMTYSYFHDDVRNNSGEDWTQIYLEKIQYTGKGGNSGPYSVEFFRESNPRTDVTISGRSGFKVVTRYRLSYIDVKFNNNIVRRYAFGYTEGRFHKSLLNDVTQYGEGGGVFFNRHTFEYFDEIEVTGSDIKGFSGEVNYSDMLKGVSKNLYTGSESTKELGGGYTSGKSLHLYPGFAPFSFFKSDSFGLKLGKDKSKNETLITIMDVNGDGLPDQVYDNGSVKYRPNLGSGQFGDEKSISGLDGLGVDESKGTTKGLEVYYKSLSGFASVNKGEAKGKSYLLDVNGDGLVDYVKGSNVKFNHLVPDENGMMKPSFSSTSPVPMQGGSVDVTGADLGDPLNINEMRAEYHKDDPLRVWKAPYTGAVRISGQIELLREPAPTDGSAPYTYEDGVIAGIQKGNKMIWSGKLVPSDGSDPIVITPTGTDSINVKANDRIYFRLNSINDGMYDQVKWDPVIEYVGMDLSRTDENGLTVYRYQASQDFSMAGSIVPWSGKKGLVKISGTIKKIRGTSDNVRAYILTRKPNPDGSYTENYNLLADLPCGQVGDIPVEMNLNIDEGEHVICLLTSDTAIDWKAVEWQPSLVYIDPVMKTHNDSGEEMDYVFRLPVSNKLYVIEASAAPIIPYVPASDETVKVLYSVQKHVYLPEPMPDDYNLKVLLAVKHGNEVFKTSVIINKDTLPGIIPLEIPISLKKDEKYYFVCVFNKDDYRKYIQPGTVALVNGGAVCTPEDTSGCRYVSSETYILKQESDPFAGGYRSWFYARWNGEEAFVYEPSPAISVMNESDMKLPKIEDKDKIEDDAEINGQSEAMKKFTQMTPPVDESAGDIKWYGKDQDCWIGPDMMSSTRTVEKRLPEPGETPDLGGGVASGSGSDVGTGRGINRYTTTKSTGKGIGVSSVIGVNCTQNESNQDTKVDYFDLNGDRYPDIVTSGEVQFTKHDGSLQSGRSKGLWSGSIRSNGGINYSGGFSFGNALSLAQTVVDSKGEVLGCMNDMPSLSVSTTAGYGTSNTDRDFMDLNGDGLPDRIESGDDGVYVRYNLGYSFGEREKWSGSSVFRSNVTANVGCGIGFAHDKTAIGGGVNKSISASGSEVEYIDLNGDGLPDRLEKKLEVGMNGISVSSTNKRMYVRFNTGDGFGPEYVWNGSIESMPMIYNETTSEDLSVYGTAYIPVTIGIVFYGTIIINGGGATNRSVAHTEVTMQDINGDGYADQVCSSSDGEVKARLNLTGKTNLLKSVNRPLGGKINIDYELTGNTWKMPQARWVMRSVTMSDGMALMDMGSGSIHIYNTSYNYANGNYDRVEREFYGFSEVKETRGDGSTNTRTFTNDSYYGKGLETKSVLRDAAQKALTMSVSEYGFRQMVENESYFPTLNKKTTTYYEGINSKFTAQNFAYDDYGNVTSFHDTGDVETTDDLYAGITYGYDTVRYIVDNPLTITVMGGDAKIYRTRTGVYDSNGNMTQLVQYNGGQSSVTDITYDGYGNVKTVTGPSNHKGERYSLTYTYDSAVNTYIENITDSFGYTSKASYNYMYGVPTSTTDLNNNKIDYSYDIFGRQTEIYGPYDIGSTPTIQMTYNIGAFPPYAHTKNKVEWNSNDTIDTVTFIDAMKRVAQVQKTAEVRKVTGFTSSGRVIYDVLGRAVSEGQPVFDPSLSVMYRHQATPKNPTNYEYDPMGRKTKITYPDATAVVMNYGIADNKFVNQVIDQEGNSKETIKDIKGTILSVKEHNKGADIVTSYDYDAMDEIVKVTDAKNNVTSIAYDKLGRRLSINNPDTGLVEYTYDNAGNMTSKMTPNLRTTGAQISYVYDYNRLVRIDYPNMEDVTYEYGSPTAGDNRVGRITKVTNGDMIDERFYGKLGETLKSIKSVRSDVPAREWRTFTTLYNFDSLGRMMNMTFPDGEKLSYTYDRGGLVNGASGRKENHNYSYLKDIEYDEYGSRVLVKYGNEANSVYEYEPLMRRLVSLKTDKGGTVYQNLSYTYDRVGNIKTINNKDFIVKVDEPARSMTQSFTYDDLYRLTNATGGYKLDLDRTNEYTNTIVYDTIGNILSKNQLNRVIHTDGSINPKQKTTYNLTYQYGSGKPHAVTADGEKTYTYDANGNMTGFQDDQNALHRDLFWNDENRITSTMDNGDLTEYRYDDSGNRVLKRGKYGEIVYVNQNYTLRNGEVAAKHVFAGQTRVATKTTMKETALGNGKPGNNSSNGSTIPEEKEIYYYHGDHLGSSNFITDRFGRVWEHLEYFPYGETWVDEHRSQVELPYQFTSKELDQETGLYYYGARYYDPRLSRWVSVDPILGKYIEGKSNRGIYNSSNLDLYMYSKSNPIIFIDENGESWVKSGMEYKHIPNWMDNIAKFFGFTVKTAVATYDSTSLTFYKSDATIEKRMTNEYGVVQFIENDRGISRFGMRDSYYIPGKGNGQHGDNWIKPEIGAALYNAVNDYLESNPSYTNDMPLVYNDISAYNPAYNLGHNTHFWGTAIDFRYMDSNGQPTDNIDQADLTRQNVFTQKLISNGFNEQFSKQGMVSGSAPASGHHDHQHSRNTNY